MIDNKLKEMEVLKIYSTEYIDKHNHFWNVYFKYMYALILILGLLLFDDDFTRITDSLWGSVLFLILYLSFNYISFLVLRKESIVIKMFGKRYDAMCTKLGVIRIYRECLTEKESKEEAQYSTRQLMIYSSRVIITATVILTLIKIYWHVKGLL